MAVVINITELTREQVDNIPGYLTIQSVNKEEEKYKIWKNVSNMTTAPPKVTLKMYSYKDGVLRLPYRFACCLLGRMFNTDLPHLRIINDNIPEFAASLRENQIEQATESLSLLRQYNTVILGLPPGFGKTYLGAWLCYMAGYAIVVLVHREVIGDQWVKTFNTCIPGLSDRIWFVGKDKKMCANPAVIICMNTRVNLVPEEIRQSIGTLIIDEAHLFCTVGNVEPLLYFQPRNIIIETATLERIDSMEKMIHLMSGEHGIFEISKIPYQVYKVNTQIEVEESRTARGVNFGQLHKALSENESRNTMIINIVKNNLHRKFIILTRLAEHVRELHRLFLAEGITADTLFKNKNKYINSAVLIGTVPKMGTGFDEENACSNFSGKKSNVLIIVLSVKQWQLYEQMRGRVMRGKSPIVIWLYDRNAICKRHFKELIPWITQTNGVVVDVNYMPDTIELPVETET